MSSGLRSWGIPYVRHCFQGPIIYSLKLTAAYRSFPIPELCLKSVDFLADRTAARSMIGYWHYLLSSVRPSVCDEVYCGAQGRCRGLKVVTSCSYEDTSATFTVGCIARPQHTALSK